MKNPDTNKKSQEQLKNELSEVKSCGGNVSEWAIMNEKHLWPYFSPKSRARVNRWKRKKQESDDIAYIVNNLDFSDGAEHNCNDNFMTRLRGIYGAWSLVAIIASFFAIGAMVGSVLTNLWLNGVI